MKRLAAVLLLLIIAASGGLFWLRGNIDGMVKNAVEKYGSEMTRASVKVDAVQISAADGRGVIRGLTIGNPAGFKTPYALKVAEIEVAVDLASVAGNVVTVTKIGVVSPDVIYEKGDSITNFDAIQKNIADTLGPSKQEGGKKLIVGEFAMRGAKAQALSLIHISEPTRPY
jgi:hypothetical protein